jgi:protein-S-isoprenylcysteine O-methyltransferase Ste14
LGGAIGNHQQQEMDMTMQDRRAVASDVRKWWLKSIIYLMLVGAILFLASGRFGWGMAWVYLVAMVLVVIANAIAMDPALLAERSQLQEGTEKWDVAIASFVGVWGPLCVYIVAGLDNRLGWSKGIGLGLQVAALVLFALGALLGTWAMASNPYFSSTVRIQTDRHHAVATQGPYRCVRHPGYIGGIVAHLMSPLALGSWIAFVPAVLIACGHVARTYLEDRFLLGQLGGYKDYASVVRYRLFPGIW